MPQFFVKKADLPGPDLVPVFASYPDSPIVARNAHGDQITPLVLPASQLLIPMPNDPPGTMPKLKDTFRNFMPQMANGKSSRRIDEVFPAYMQSNANADNNSSTMKYGAASVSWPPDAKARKAEADRGWNYIAAVRQSSDALSTQTTTIDPTDNSHWPTVITVIYIPPAVS